jgi:hypothetical protein
LKNTGRKFHKEFKEKIIIAFLTSNENSKFIVTMLTVYTGLTHGHIPIVITLTVYTGLTHDHIPIVTTLTVYTGLTHGHIPIVTTLTVYTDLTV